MSMPDEGGAPVAEEALTADETVLSPEPIVGEDALGAAGRALAAVENLPLERHPEAFAHFDELLRAALEAPPHVASG